MSCLRRSASQGRGPGRAEPATRLGRPDLDVDHTPELPLASANASFYTEAGLERARCHLAPGGVLAVWSYADSMPFAAALRRVFADVRVEPIVVFNDLNGVETTDWRFLARDVGR
ncbi:MAG: hypothetical protein HY908_08600 [Myxococcales bacterium]|nr:hypothetical protein [Myxococcales bacterium]